MTLTVSFSDDAASVLGEARTFLAAEPVLHNVILTLLSERAADPIPGRYWVARDGDAVVGVVFQSPITFSCSLPCMAPEVIAALVDAIADRGVELPGAIGEVSTVARFAGQWTERHKSGATPVGGQRIYEVNVVEGAPETAGHLRAANPADRDVVIGMLRGFADELDEHGSDPEQTVDRRPYWLWDDDAPVSLAGTSAPVEGVGRIGPVYTPPECRRRGYAGACVAEVSRRILADGHRCILYTDLANATSNSIYRRIGYRAVAEVLRYRFE